METVIDSLSIPDAYKSEESADYWRGYAAGAQKAAELMRRFAARLDELPPAVGNSVRTGASIIEDVTVPHGNAMAELCRIPTEKT